MSPSDSTIRPLREADLDAADRIFRLAFGTFVGLADPLTFAGDRELVRPRWRAAPEAAFGAELGGELAGSNFAAHWGSVGFFGPLTVRPDLWDRGIAKGLLEPVIDLFSAWVLTHTGLFTFPQSARHVHVYQRFGFWPRFLTAIMWRDVRSTPTQVEWQPFSSATDAGQWLLAGAALTDSIYPGLDLRDEIQSVARLGLGETVLVAGSTQLEAFAICHCGAGTEAGGGDCYIKFAAVRPGQTAATHFERLIDACDAFAAAKGLNRLVAGVNTARHEAYRRLIAFGFRTDMQGVTMHRPNETGYDRPDVYVLDDWR